MKKLLMLAPLVLCLSGCSWFTRTEQKQTDMHRNEKTVVTETTKTTGTQGGQPVDLTVTKTTTSKTTRDDSTSSQSQSDVSSPALDRLEGIVEKLAAHAADAYLPGAGGLVSSAIHALGLNENTAAGLAGVGASLAGWHLHKRGKKKGHEEAKKGLPPL
jgi:hypothetical protein